MACVLTETPPPKDYMLYYTHFSPPLNPLTPQGLLDSPLMLIHGCQPPVAITSRHQSFLHELTSLLRELINNFFEPGPATAQRQRDIYQEILETRPSPPETSKLSANGLIRETCQIAAIIFAAAIIDRVPLSRAVEKATQDSNDPQLLDHFGDAINESPYYRISYWGPWAGCFFWASMVAGAVASYGTEGLDPRDDNFRRLRRRRALLTLPIAFNTKLFPTRVADDAFVTLETMLYIQELLSEGARSSSFDEFNWS